MLSISSLTTGYVRAPVLRDVSIDVGDGMVAVLGTNGAGKTTSLRMLLGLIRPTEGTAKLFGRNPLNDGARALQGVAGFVEEPRFYPYLTGRKNLELLAAFDGGEASSRIDEALDTVDLADRARDRVGGYSHGMRQRLGIAAALLRDPSLLLLDEPTTGLDPPGMRDMRTLIGQLSERGVTVLLSSHQLAEVEEMCNRVAIIRSGQIVYEGVLAELKRTAGGGYRLRSTDAARAIQVCEAQAGIAQVRLDGHEVRFAADSDEAVAALSIALVEAGVGITALAPTGATLEELFFRLTEGEAANGVPEAPRVPAEAA